MERCFNGRRTASRSFHSGLEFLVKGEMCFHITIEYKLKVLTYLIIRQSEGDLYALGTRKGPKKGEKIYASILLMDEMRDKSGSIIECCFVDKNWIFVRERTDRSRPNGRKTINGIYINFLKSKTTLQSSFLI